MIQHKLDLMACSLLPPLANEAWHGFDLALLSFWKTTNKMQKEAL
jgi:hypothetical protein